MNKYNMDMETDVNTIPGKVISQIKPNSVVLEFGPANGRMTCYMKEELGCQVYIVEINKDAYSEAIQYAIDGICGNIEDYEWVKKFKGIKFDYIVFADVLEHLTAPDKVLKQAEALLKEEGTLLVSIPNIGHADILLKLYLNKFEYTSIGILDDTHVHFWGYDNLESYFNQCGFSIQIEDATYMAPFFTEQHLKQEHIPFELKQMIYRRKMSDVYEFFLVLKKSSYFYKESLHKEMLIKQHIIDDLYATVFFDCGEGYSQEKARTIYPKTVFENNYVEYFIEDIPKECIGIRFDPVEEMGVIVSDLFIQGNNGIYQGTALNGIQIDRQWLFSTEDPQIEIKLETGCNFIKIKAQIYKYTNDSLYEIIQGLEEINQFKQQVKNLEQEMQCSKMKNIELTDQNLKINKTLEENLFDKVKLEECLVESSKTNKELSKIITEIETERVELYKKLEVLTQEKEVLYNKIINKTDEMAILSQKNKELLEERIQLQQELVNTRSNLEYQIQTELQKKEAILHELNVSQELIAHLNHQINEINIAYNVILDSQCWRITKPIRKVLEMIKSTKIGHLSHKMLFYIKHFGVRKTAHKVLSYISNSSNKTANIVLADYVDEEFTNFKKFVKAFNEHIKNSNNTIYLSEVLESYDQINRKEKDLGKVVLLVSHELDLTGAPIALYYFAKSLKASGNYPVIICRTDGRLTEDITNDGIPVVVYQGTYTDDLIERISPLFDFVVANTIVSHPVITRLSDKDIPVVWWIHEAVVSYSEEVLNQISQTVASNIHIYCVGAYAKKVLLNYRNRYSTKEFLYYVPENNKHSESVFRIDNPENKIIFAIIGMQEIRKGQDVLADAIANLTEENRSKALFVFIGRKCNPYIGDKIQQICKKYPNNTRYIEELTQQQIHDFYEQMDCFVCASKDDPMPIVVTEAMMHSKAIICSENTGSARLLKDMNSGFVYHNDNYLELAEKITYVIENIDCLDEMRSNARKTYDRYFSKQVFDENVRAIIRDIDVEMPNVLIPLVSNQFSNQCLIKQFKQKYMRENDIILGEEIFDEYDKNTKGRKVLLISHELSLTGAPIALHYLAKTLLENGDCPIILSPYDGKMKEEIAADNIPVIVYQDIYSSNFLRDYEAHFDLIILNTVVVYRAIFSLMESKTPIMWWIHDSNASYDIGGFKSCLPSQLPENLKIYCAGNYARSALIKNYPNYKADTFLYFVPDLREKLGDAPKVDMGNNENKFTFTIIGMQDDRKGQDIYVEAIELLSESIIEKCNFVFIGKRMSERVWDKIQLLLEKYPNNTQYVEEVSREAMISVYDTSDCIVCASKDDPMPVFVTEAMIMSKAIICSEYTGSADLIKEMNSGFTYANNDPKLLAEKMKYVYENFEMLKEIRKNARVTYEKYFSKRAFNQSVEEITSGLYMDRDKDEFDGIVSVVIPTYNAGENFPTLLKLLKSQEKIRKIEVTVVDSGSKDNTIGFCKELGINLIQISQEQFSHSYARNLGAESSKGDIVIFMTQDAMPTSTLWVSNLIKPLVKEGVAAVSCSEICNDDIELYYKVASYMHSKYIGVDKGDVVCEGKSFKSQDELRKKASLNDVTCVVNHKVFDSLKYRYNYAEDLDLGIRLLKAGYKLKLMSSEKVIHGHNRNAGYYVKRALVEDKALAVIMNIKNPTRSDNMISKRIIIGYKGITTIINNLRVEIKDKVTINEFFDKLNSQFVYILNEDMLNMAIDQLAYDDAIIDETVNMLHGFLNEETGDEIKDIIHMCYYYADTTLRQYLEMQYYELDVDVIEEIYDAIYKQMAVFMGIDLARLEEESKLKPYIHTLTEGV